MAALICDACGDPVDTDDTSRWRASASGTYYHTCSDGQMGAAVLKRRPERQEQIDDERQQLAEAAPKIATEARRAVLQRELHRK